MAATLQRWRDLAGTPLCSIFSDFCKPASQLLEKNDTGHPHSSRSPQTGGHTFGQHQPCTPATRASSPRDVQTPTLPYQLRTTGDLLAVSTPVTKGEHSTAPPPSTPEHSHGPGSPGHFGRGSLGEVNFFWGEEVSHKDMNHAMLLVFRAREWARAFFTY